VKVKIWGTRGSIPSPLKPTEVRKKIRRAILGLPDIDTTDPVAVDAYLDQLSPLVSGTAGGNTTCVEIQAGHVTFIIDAGSGLRELGQELIKGACGRGQGILHFLFTHPHWDHLQGFPFFVPAFIPGNQLFIHSIHDIKFALENQQNSLNFPVPLSVARATIEFISHEVGEPFSIGGVNLNTIRNAHPGDAYAYRFEDGHNIFVFASDAEYKHLSDEASLRPYIEFFKDADALIFDAQYTLKEGFQKEDWGHSSAMIGVDLARKAGAKRLLLFHHDPTYSDEQLLDIQQRAIEYQAQNPSGPSCEIIVAYEGLTLDLTPPGDISLQQLSDDEEAVLTPVGSFDEKGLASLERQLSYWEEEGWPSRLVIDLSETESLTIAGLKLLISLRKERVDTVIALAGLSESAQQVIELAGFLDYFAIYPTVEAALAALQAAETLNLPGQLIKDRYRIESRLRDDSWQGAVFKATDIHTNRIVALTILSASFGESAINEIIRQTQQVVALKHPNITNVLDFGIDQGFSYIVEEFIEGQSLLEVLKYYSGEPLPIDRARDISLGILSALEYAHSRGIIHYNLTPRNIYLADELKLTNFGLGDLEKGRQLLERPLVLLEAPYLAPEQILGQSPDARTDLYALGAIMYELFTGRPLFTGTDLEVMQAHLNQPPDPPSLLNPQLSGSLEYLILKLLAKDPDERYATVHQTRQILSSLVVGDEGETGLSALFYGERTPLVNRASELERMEAVRATVQKTGTPHLVVVRGEMGVGKSRLVAEFLLRSIEEQDFTVLMGRCDEFGAPYAPYAEILTTIFNRGFVNPQTIVDQAKHLRLQIPSLASVLSPYEDGTSSVLTDAKGAQWHFFEAILLILSKLGPTALVLEDAALLDEASIALTRFLIRRAQLPLLIIVSGRDDEEANPWLNAFQSGQNEIISLQPLPVPEVEEYLTSLMGGTISKEVAMTVQRRTHGNPYFIEEITNYLIDQGTFYQNEAGEWAFNPENGVSNLPPTLMKRFAERAEKLTESRRIEDLTESSREALAMAAVIGSEFDFRLWVDILEAEMGGESQEALALDTLDEALALRILHQADDERYIFDSVDIADILVSSLFQSHQRSLHQRIAELLSQQDEDPLIISQHYQEAELTTEAAHYLEVAGAKAMADHAINDAITYYDRAMVLEESQAGYETLGNLYRQKGASTEAIWAFERALKLAQEAKDSLGQARILNGLSFVYWWMLDRYEEAHQAAIQVLNLSDVPEIERATAQSHLGMISWTVGRLDEAEDWCRKSLDTFIGSEDEDRLAAVYSRLGLVYFSKGKFAEATEAAEQALEIRRSLDDRWGQAMCLNNLARIAADQGDFELAQAHFASARQLLEDMDSPGGLMLIYTHQGHTRLLQKQADNAVSSLLKALDQTEELRQPSAHALGLIYLLLAQARLQRDDLSQAREAIDAALKLVEPVQSQEQIATARATLAQIHAAEGDHTTADVLFQKSLDLFEEVGSPAGLLRTQMNYAQFLSEQGRTDEANALEQAARDEAHRLGLYL